LGLEIGPSLKRFQFPLTAVENPFTHKSWSGDGRAAVVCMPWQFIGAPAGARDAAGARPERRKLPDFVGLSRMDACSPENWLDNPG
jgi:hypothetical protein